MPGCAVEEAVAEIQVHQAKAAELHKLESALPTVRQIRDWVVERELPIDIEVDGGIGSHNVGLARNAGANVFVAGTAVFGKPKDGSPPDYAGRIAAIRENAGG